MRHTPKRLRPKLDFGFQTFTNSQIIKLATELTCGESGTAGLPAVGAAFIPAAEKLQLSHLNGFQEHTFQQIRLDLCCHEFICYF